MTYYKSGWIILEQSIVPVSLNLQWSIKTVSVGNSPTQNHLLAAFLHRSCSALHRHINRVAVWEKHYYTARHDHCPVLAPAIQWWWQKGRTCWLKIRHRQDGDILHGCPSPTAFIPPSSPSPHYNDFLLSPLLLYTWLRGSDPWSFGAFVTLSHPLSASRLRTWKRSDHVLWCQSLWEWER